MRIRSLLVILPMFLILLSSCLVKKTTTSSTPYQPPKERVEETESYEKEDEVEESVEEISGKMSRDEYLEIIKQKHFSVDNLVSYLKTMITSQEMIGELSEEMEEHENKMAQFDESDKKYIAQKATWNTKKEAKEKWSKKFDEYRESLENGAVKKLDEREGKIYAELIKDNKIDELEGLKIIQQGMNERLLKIQDYRKNFPTEDEYENGNFEVFN